jgi:outer membrane protein assembly factor BamB
VVGSAAIPGGAASDPALAQGMLFVVTAGGQLLAFR